MFFISSSPGIGSRLLVRVGDLLLFCSFLFLMAFPVDTFAQSRCLSAELTVRTTANGQSIATACSSGVSRVVFANEFIGTVAMESFTYQWQFLAADFSGWISIEGANEATYSPDLESLPNPEGLSLFRVYVIVDNGTPVDGTDDCWQYSSAAAGLSISEADCSRLPVEWLSFGADAGAKQVELQWETTHEPDNAGFHVERSPDGLDWIVIGEQLPLSDDVYDFMDEAPLTGDNYYRVRQTDFDGTITYSSVEMVNFVGAVESISVFPNPITDAFTVVVPSAFGEQLDLSLYDVRGRLVRLQTFAVNKGVRVETQDLSTGLYLLRASSQDGKLQQTVRLVR